MMLIFLSLLLLGFGHWLLALLLWPAWGLTRMLIHGLCWQLETWRDRQAFTRHRAARRAQLGLTTPPTPRPPRYGTGRVRQPLQ
jgi:hypothetical protein